MQLAHTLGENGPEIEFLIIAGAMLLLGVIFFIYESRERGTTIWGGRAEYRLRRVGDAWRMARKKVMLVDNDRPLSTLAFLV